MRIPRWRVCTLAVAAACCLACAADDVAVGDAASRVREVRPPEIKTVRKRLGVSQAEFALMIGVSTRTLQNWEQARRRP